MQIPNDRRYIIIDAREVSVLDFTEFLEERDTVMYNVDRTKSVVKYVGATPTYRFQYRTLGPYTRDELRFAQSDLEWPFEDL